MSIWDIEYSRRSKFDVESKYISTSLIKKFIDARHYIDEELSELQWEVFYSITDYVDHQCEENENTDVPSFVYFIEAVGQGKTKIGKANNVEERLKMLQTGNPYELKITGKMEFKNSAEALRCESYLHKVYANERILIGSPSERKKTEWFNFVIKESFDEKAFLKWRDDIVSRFNKEDTKKQEAERNLMEVLEKMSEGVYGKQQ